MKPSIPDLFKMIYSSGVYSWERHYNSLNINLVVSSSPEYVTSTGSTDGFYILMSDLCNIADVQYYTLDNIMISAASMFTTLTGALFVISYSR